MVTALAQDSFAELFVRWRKIRDYDNVGAWLRRIAIRRAVRVRARDKVSQPIEGITADPGDTATEHVDLRLAILALTPRQRAVVVLHYLEDQSVEQIATVLGCSPSTVKVHLHRARQTLRVDLRANSLTGDLP